MCIQYKRLGGSSRNPNSPEARHAARLILRHRPRPHLRAVSARHAVAEPKRRRPRLRAGRRSHRPLSPTPPSPSPSPTPVGSAPLSLSPLVAVPEPEPNPGRFYLSLSLLSLTILQLVVASETDDSWWLLRYMFFNSLTTVYVLRFPELITQRHFLANPRFGRSSDWPVTCFCCCR
jgi:hypothetical protein